MRKIATGLLLLALTACGSAATTPTGSDSTGTGSAPMATSPAATTASGDAPVSATPGTDLLGSTGDLEKNVISLLSATTNSAADSLKLQNKEQVEWPNGGLGCPKPGMMYTEALVPGYKLTFTDGTQTYEVHTDQTGDTAIWCDNGEPKSLGTS